jgi:hypothetical protein
MTFTPTTTPASPLARASPAPLHREPFTGLWRSPSPAVSRCAAPSVPSPNNRRTSSLSAGILMPARFVFFLGDPRHGFKDYSR